MRGGRKKHSRVWLKPIQWPATRTFQLNKYKLIAIRSGTDGYLLTVMDCAAGCLIALLGTIHLPVSGAFVLFVCSSLAGCLSPYFPLPTIGLLVFRQPPRSRPRVSGDKAREEEAIKPTKRYTGIVIIINASRARSDTTERRNHNRNWRHKFSICELTSITIR